ncbi:hypothetical protein MP638_002879 [Amoeboaphelidium occidentale]|nr:hypothetical protein MP638_002879 [Amoeboaphelidium occidentale]
MFAKLTKKASKGIAPPVLSYLTSAGETVLSNQLNSATPAASGHNAQPPASQTQPSVASTSATPAPAAGSSQNSSVSIQVNVSAGILLVRVVEARNLQGLNATSAAGLPYAVIEFDKNEFVAEASGDLNALKWTQRANFDVSRDSEVSVALYQRLNSAVQSQKPVASSLLNNARKQTRAPLQPAQETVVIGTVRVKPKFLDQRPEDAWFPLISPNGSVAGEVHIQLLFRKVGTRKPMAIEDFDLLKVIGKGSFGKVMQVRKKDTSRIYAMKIIRKANIVERSEVEHTLAERNVLAQMQNPFIVNLKFSFQSPDKLYLVLAFVNGGELFHHLQTEGCFHEERAKFYAAELLSALECLHRYNIIYRDLKPENILLDYTGHIALCDFGLCKLNMTKDDTTNTFCGTPEYLAPELLIGNGYTKVVDWWTLGVLLYEMIVGLPPFYSENTNEMYRKILSDPLRFPDDSGVEGPVVSPLGKAILSRLLERDPNRRLGANGADEIRKHPFFENIDWDKLNKKLLIPPFRPNVSSATDTSNFSDEFTSETPTDSYIENAPALSKSVQDQFQGFTYIGNEGNAMYGSSMRTGQTFQQKGPLG